MSDPINFRPDAMGTQNLIISNAAKPLVRQVAVVIPHASSESSNDGVSLPILSGVKDRRQSDRRQEYRRQKQSPHILDTRSSRERRRDNRRSANKSAATDALETEAPDDIAYMGCEAIV